MASVLTVDAPGKGASRDWARKYPPLVAVLLALALAALVLPSALHVPQSNPQTTLEYAPVPPSDEKTPPPANGNLSSLGLAGSSSFTGAGPGGDEGALPVDNSLLGGNKKTATAKHCVGNPPRQTEDPLSPPCVADFHGDNFGATYQGVTADQVTVLFYVQGFTDYTNTCRDAAQVTPDRHYFDLEQPAQPGEHCEVRVLRNWQTYFNDRFETYGRRVHFWAYFSGSGNSAEERRADAADNYARLHPFAVMTVADGQTYGDDYLDVMAQRNVLNFGSFLGRDEAFFNRYPKLIWGYQPSIEHQADLYSTYVCTKMKGPVEANFTNMPQDVGKPRKFGMWHTDDAGHPELQKLAAAVKASLQKCGITIAADNTFPEAGFAKSAHYAPTKAQTAAADFQTKGITTILWPGGLETNFSAAAANIGYRPEILVMGDQVIETETNGGFQDQSVWDHSRVISNVPYVSDERTQLCYTAYKEVEPDADDAEVRADACPLYPQIRQLFTGIQVAGPRLGPTSVDKGFHAVPRVASTNPMVPACFYDVNDYTCVKDAKVEHWDQTGRTSTAQQTPGCYRGTEQAKRYLTGTWPPGNATAQDTPNDPCDAYDGGYLINPAPPSTSDPTG
ncbi:MAG: hypothetical protein JOZ37_12985 [Actinobacteria bacterium]|nr:hypothetical protein [Actinomycetota bacterium]MBV8961177.1 hypothetical protein [Actinomycetota bacterium]MBV9664876.1 hypothetical protein [Actinomycetota bacterium]MBV9934943.1 hypothetical protein [Actinomycetota bacterium]